MNNIIKINHKKTRNVSLMSSNRANVGNEYNNKKALTQASDNTSLYSLMRNEIIYRVPCFKKINNKQLRPYPLLQQTTSPKIHQDNAIRKNNDSNTHTNKIYQQYNDRDVVKSLSCFDFTNKETESTVMHQELAPSLSKPNDKKLRISLIKQSKDTNKKNESIRVKTNHTNSNTHLNNNNPIDYKSLNLAGVLLRTARDINLNKTKTKFKLTPKASFNVNETSSIVNEEIEAPENLHFIFVSLIQRNKKCLSKSEYKGCRSNAIEDDYDL